MDIVVNHLNFNSKHHEKCEVVLKFIPPIHYRPQRSWGKVMFLHLSVSHSVHKGISVPHAPQVT